MSTKTFKCPFCKDVIFFTEHDLQQHLKAGIRQPVPVNAPAINEVDHRNYYQRLHAMVEFGRPEDYC